MLERGGYFLCVICEELHPRKSNVQKYCPRCKSIGKAITEHKYYVRHRAKIKARRRKWYRRNKERVAQYNRKYFQEYGKVTSGD